MFRPLIKMPTEAIYREQPGEDLARDCELEEGTRNRPGGKCNTGVEFVNGQGSQVEVILILRHECDPKKAVRKVSAKMSHFVASYHGEQKKTLHENPGLSLRGCSLCEWDNRTRIHHGLEVSVHLWFVSEEGGLQSHFSCFGPFLSPLNQPVKTSTERTQTQRLSFPALLHVTALFSETKTLKKWRVGDII